MSHRSKTGVPVAELIFEPMSDNEQNSLNSSTRLARGILLTMAYIGRLCPKGTPFSGRRYMKGLRDFTPCSTGYT